MNLQERYSRQGSIVPEDRIAKCSVTVIGVGAIGRNVAIQLTSIGIPRLQLIDFDTVEESNIASQGYTEGDLGKPKVQATAEACRRINQNIVIDEHIDRFMTELSINDIVFCCVDSIETRAFIFDAIKSTCKLFIDGRMAAETLRVLVADHTNIDRYQETLFPGEEAAQLSCTAKTTIYCANIAAGFLVSSFTKWLRGIPNDSDISLNLLSNEIVAG